MNSQMSDENKRWRAKHKNALASGMIQGKNIHGATLNQNEPLIDGFQINIFHSKILSES